MTPTPTTPEGVALLAIADEMEFQARSGPTVDWRPNAFTFASRIRALAASAAPKGEGVSDPNHFEQWIVARWNRDVSKCKAGDYKDAITRMCWESWCAASASNTPKANSQGEGVGPLALLSNDCIAGLVATAANEPDMLTQYERACIKEAARRLATPTAAPADPYAPSDCIDRCGSDEPCDKTRCPLPENAAAPGEGREWVLALREELKRAAMKDVFTLSRDEVIQLMGETAISLMAAPAAPASGGMYVHQCPNCPTSVDSNKPEPPQCIRCGTKMEQDFIAEATHPAAVRVSDAIEWRWLDEHGRAMTEWKPGEPPPMATVSDAKGMMRVEVRAALARDGVEGGA